MKAESPAPQSKTSHKGSATGSVLAIISLVLSAIGSGLIHAKYKPTGATTGSVDEKVGTVVASGTTKFLGTIFGVPLLVGGIVLAVLAIVFILIRLRKVHVSGLLFSLVAGALAIWSFTIATEAFSTIKARPVENSNVTE